MTISDKVKEAILGTWLEPIREWGIEDVFDRTMNGVIHAYSNQTVFPPKSKIFRAFKECPYDELSVVFMGQDPYHDGSATGLCFANEGDGELSPSLRILKREWEENENGGEFDPSLLPWAHQGVLLLNSALTVVQSDPKSHLELWKHWTGVFLRHLSENRPDILYVFFGNKAYEWKEHVKNGHTLKVVHPAAESYSNGHANFYGSRPFEKINAQLEYIDKVPILW